MKVSSIDQTFADMLEYYGKQILQWARARAILEPIALKMDEMDINNSFGGGKHMYITFSGDKKRLTEVIRALRTHGWHSEEKPAEKASEWTTYFKRENDEEDVEGNKYLIRLAFTSTVCTRVQIGTETKKVPIYEVRCGDVEETTVSAAPVDDLPF